jgi:4'-phosphopantetheinyl transferase
MQLLQKIRENPAQKDMLNLWQIDFRAWEHEADAILNLLDLEEKKRLQSYKVHDKALAYTIAHGFMRLFFSEILQLPPQELRFLQGAYGKPYLANSPQTTFNLSYSSPWLLFAHTDASLQLGVDIEAIKPRRQMLQIIEQFHPEEKAAILHLKDDEQLKQFYRLWTCKEAYIKALGMGLSLPLNSFAVDLETATIRGEKQWSLHEFVFEEKHLGAVVVDCEKSLRLIQI